MKEETSVLSQWASFLEELKWNKLVINRKKQKAILMHKTIKRWHRSTYKRCSLSKNMTIV